MSINNPKLHQQTLQELKARLAEYERGAESLRLLIHLLEKNPPK